ncbi:RecX family transcriptional regulator [Paenibacillus hamazuiensis]|uniref:RecX family transcriptional regulator n=1 Tax=Paenibacillus hamazuiensis TaxID=2936508 RepID=UPI002010AEC3|nr:RecX family transcriptional regulator [Paenibacillus hamazuiensis]
MNQDQQVDKPSGVISKVEKQEKQQERYNIYIEDKYAFSVYEDTLIKYKLFKGTAVDIGQIEQILKADELQRAYRTAILALSRRLRTEQELQSRLAGKGYDPEISREIIRRLKAEGYINDYEYAVSLTKQRVMSQKKGRLYVRQELLHKGIPKELATEALQKIDPETEYEQALELALKRWNRSSDQSREAKRKIAAFLLRRGYPGSVVSQVVKNLHANKQHSDEDEHADEIEFD